jgi:glycerol 2-dehydrogenase (NADP+)
MTSRLTNQINLQVDAPEGVLPTQEHTIKGKSGKKLLDLDLCEDVSPTWAEMEKVS